MTVSVYTGAIWRSCDVVPVAENIPATPEAVAEAANIPLEAAGRALDYIGYHVHVGWVDPASGDVVLKVPDDAIEIDQGQFGDPVWETNDGIWEPFYVYLCEEWGDENDQKEDTR